MRHEARVDWSEAVYDKTFDSNIGASDFERNLIRFRAEMHGPPRVREVSGSPRLWSEAYSGTGRV